MCSLINDVTPELLSKDSAGTIATIRGCDQKYCKDTSAVAPNKFNASGIVSLVDKIEC